MWIAKSFKRFALLLIFVLSQCTTQDSNTTETIDEGLSYTYPIRPVDIQHVKLTDQFWLPIVKRIQEKTITYAIQKCEEEGRMDNFLVAGGQLEDTIQGAMPFDDTDLYKIIEGASNTLISSPDPQLEVLLDSLIAIIAVGQEPDGYLTTWRTADPDNPPAPWVKVVKGERWESLEASHELYNPGHLYEAAAVHYRATGKKNFLDIALKNADLMVKTFGDEAGQIATVPGHQIIETGLLQLYKITGNKEYLELAKYFLDSRGNPDNHTLFGPYSQDHIPAVEQREVVGHAVRAMYMYAAMTDIAVLMDDAEYRQAILALWDNMVHKKMYITGGIGARHEGESFGENYELPNLTAYSETCAAIGSIYWNHRLFQMTGDVKYFDIIERTIYNGMISGISLDGTKFFYPNALESDGKYTFNRGACSRSGWFDCSCCPTNIIRFLPSMPSLIYAKADHDLYVNMFTQSSASVSYTDGKVDIQQETEYPWKGGVNFMVRNDTKVPKTLKIRIPYWLRNEAVPGDLYTYINKVDPGLRIYEEEKPQNIKAVRGYWEFNIPSETETTIRIDFENPVHLVRCHEAVEENRGLASLEYGPLVYAFEIMDNPTNFESITIHKEDTWQPEWQQELLNGIMVLRYADAVAIPYYAWSNRGIGKMKVWTTYGNK